MGAWTCFGLVYEYFVCGSVVLGMRSECLVLTVVLMCNFMNLILWKTNCATLGEFGSVVMWLPLFHVRAFPFIFYSTGYEILQLFHSLKQVAREMNKLFVQKSTVIALVLMGLLCWNLQHFGVNAFAKLVLFSDKCTQDPSFHWGHSPFPKY